MTGQNHRVVQASEAKARLLQLLDDVERGESVVITRHGRPVARLSPEVEGRRAEIAAAIAGIRAIGRRVRERNGPMTAEEMIALRDEGRRF
jgi:prevent-host-death family protein